MCRLSGFPVTKFSFLRVGEGGNFSEARLFVSERHDVYVEPLSPVDIQFNLVFISIRINNVINNFIYLIILELYHFVKG